jgi:hypothetical protein
VQPSVGQGCRTAQLETNSAGLDYCLICEALFSAGLREPHCWLEVEDVLEIGRAEDG